MPGNDDLNYGETLRGLREGMRVFGSRYVLQRRLGRGGMGEVWLAEDVELERKVAIKFLPEVIARDPAAVRDLKREARRALDLTHVNIVRVYDFLADDHFAGISMEYVDGESLASKKSKQPEGFFEWEAVQAWLPKLFLALTYAHEEAKIVHRDLKPANILMTKNGELKIADFGISSSITDTVSRVSVHASSSGTPVYMSPQQMMGDPPSVSDDVYSLGATFCELLTGRPPFYTGNIILQVQSKEPPSITARRKELNLEGDEIPVKVEKVVASCLSKDPGDRPETIQKVKTLLEGKEEPAVAKAKPPPIPVSETTKISEAEPEAAPKPPEATPVEKKVVQEPLRIKLPQHPPQEIKPAKASRKVGLVFVTITLLFLLVGAGYYFGIHRPNNLSWADTIDYFVNRIVQVEASDSEFPVDSAVSAAEAEARLLEEEAIREFDSRFSGKEAQKAESFPFDQQEISEAEFPVEIFVEEAEGLTAEEKSVFVEILSNTVSPDLTTEEETTLVEIFSNASNSTEPLPADYPPEAFLDELEGLTEEQKNELAEYFSGGNPFDQPLSPYVSDDLTPEERISMAEILSNASIYEDPMPPGASGLNFSYQPVPGEDWVVPDLGLEMVWIDPGEFTMGSPMNEKGRYSSETQHRVRLTKGFWLGKYEVTQEQWEALMGFNPSEFKESGKQAPVEQVSWQDAMEFCQVLTNWERLVGRLPSDLEYSLPTEAEWEFACRAGSVGPYGGPDLGSMAWYSSNSRGRTHPVGQKLSNAWDIYDMHGNVWEWCLDWYGDYPKAMVTDPQGARSRASRIYRGGSWDNKAENCRSARRRDDTPNSRRSPIGFRLFLRSNSGQEYASLGSVVEETKPEIEKDSGPSIFSLGAPIATVAPAQRPFQGTDWTIPNIELEMVWIEPGEFTMGTPSSEFGREYDEIQHRVQITAGYWLGKYEVTQGEWETVMGRNSSKFKKSGKRAPAEQISWDEAMDFCWKLTEREQRAGRLPSGYEYFLPTEAEWEFACRAGTTGAYAGRDLDRLAWYVENSGLETHPVGQKSANPWGLYDMHGNVYEWCLDWFGDYTTRTVKNPQGPAVGSVRVLRGGSWGDRPVVCRSGQRGGGPPENSADYIGFRLSLKKIY